MGKVALVAGATGLVGHHLVEILCNSKQYTEIKLLSRRELDFKHEKLNYILIENFDLLINEKTKIFADDIFCCLGTTIKTAGSKEKFYQVDFEYPVKIAELAFANKARQYLLVSAMGANAKSSIFYNKVKGEVEQAIKKVGFDSVHIFRPSLLMGNRSENRLGEKIGKVVMQSFSPIMLAGLKKYRPIKAITVATAMHNCAIENSRGVQIHDSEKIKQLAE